MDKVNFELVGNNQDLIKKISEAQAAFVNLGKTAEEQGSRINAAFNNISLESVRQLRQTLLGMPGELRGLNSIGKQISDLDRQLGQIEKELVRISPSAGETFTGISDNMPVVINSLKEAREQFKGFNAAGQGSGPVWKQALSALGSWQTAVAAGITLLAIYGDKVVEWFQNLGKAPGYINKAKIEQDVLNESVQEYSGHLSTAYSESGRQALIISQLSTEWGKLGNDLSAKKKFIDGNKEAFSQLGVEINSVKDAENLLVTNTGNFIAAIKLRAKAMAGQSTLQSLYAEQQTLEEQVEMGKKVAEARAKVPTADDAKEARKRNIWSAASSATGGGNVSYTSVKQVTAGDIAKEKAQQMLIGVKQNEARLDAIEKQIGRRAQRMLKDNQEYNKLMDQAGLKTQKPAPINTNVEDKARKESEQELQIKNAKDYAHQLEELYYDAEQAKVDGMAEGSEKALAQMELNHEKELIAIDRQKEEFLQRKKDNAKGEFDASSIILSDDETQMFDDKYKAVLSKQANEKQAYYDVEKQALNKSLEDYSTYQQKYQAITDFYNARIAKATTAEQRKSLEGDREKAISALNSEANKKASSFDKLFKGMKDRTVKDMISIANEAQAALDYVDAGEFKKDSGGNGLFGISKETFDLLRKSPDELDKVKQGIKDTKAEAANFDNAFTKMAGGFKKVFEEGGDPKKLQEGLAQIEGAMNEVMAAGKFLSNSLSSLGDAFGSDTLKGIAEGMNVAMDAASATMDGAKAGAAFGPWGAAAGAAIGLATSLASSIAKIHDAKNEKRIQALQEQIDTLNKSYEKLGDSVDKAYSSDASQLIEQQNQLLEQQKLLIRNQIMEEQSKKNADDGRIKEWQNQIEEINKTLEENKEKQIDVIFGEDVKAAIDNFAQAYADAWAAGDDKAKSSKDFVKNMIRQMVMESIKAASSKPMEELRKKLAGFFSDGIISAWEQGQIEEDAARLMSELDGKFAWADRFMKDDEAEEDSTREASQKGIAQASQESVDKLDGVMTNIQGHTYSIDDNVRAILETMKGTIAPGMPGAEKATGFSNHTVSLADIDRNMSSMIGLGSTAVSHLSSIADNTARLMTIEQTMSSIKTGIDTMNTKGITIKR